METKKRRYVGIDLGKREYTLAIIGKNGKISIHQGKTSSEGRAALYGLLEKSDKGALEAGNLAFIMAREIQERVGRGIKCGETTFYLRRTDEDGQRRRDEAGSSDRRTAG